MLAVVPKLTLSAREPSPEEREAEAHPSDQAIANGIAQGREWAADALYSRVQPVVDQCLRRILRSTGPDYDDLMQAAFERIITALSRKPLGGKGDLRAWSAAVATHVALDNLRRRGRERRLFQWHTDADVSSSATSHSLTPYPSGQPCAEGRLEARSEVNRVQAILVNMKPAAAETLLLHDVLGYELAEVAQLTGVTLAAAQSRLVRSRREFLRRARTGSPTVLR